MITNYCAKNLKIIHRIFKLFAHVAYGILQTMKLEGKKSIFGTHTFVRWYALFIPIIIILYGLLIQYEFLDGRRLLTNGQMIVFGLFWIVLSLFSFLAHNKNKLYTSLRIILHTFFGLAFMFCVTGTASPILILWIIPIFAALYYFGHYTLLAMLASVLLVILLDAITFPNSLEYVVNSLIGFISLVVLSLMALLVYRELQQQQSDYAQLLEKGEHEHDRLLALVNNLTDPIISVDKKGIVRLYNAASLNLVDTNGSLIGHHIDEALPLKDRDGAPVELFSIIQSHSSSHTQDDLYYDISEDDTLRIEMTTAPIRSAYHNRDDDDTNAGYVVILRDVTKAKSLEEERDEFISVVSHELRTPITITEGSISNAELIVERKPDDTKSVAAALKEAHHQIIFLAHMVNDLSTLSRAERGVGDACEDIDVKEMAEKLYHNYLPQAQEKGLTLNLDLGSSLGSVNSSPLYLEELLQNFITNAIKYTQEGEVTLHIKKVKNTVLFSVKDSGIGISKTDQKKIFEKFYRAEDYRTRETSGTGLGLYVSSKLARKLGCKIEVTSRLNHGSAFSFTLPSA
ncbi:hypothetical protein FJZ39_01280 [Candidatus Saccharibacteria bacterium]|nr:hypothetical protein [Candidatus Saccharibacteria bacterium]